MTSRITANDRVRRMLAIIPWVASRPDGVPIDELCARFRIDRKFLVDDLITASFVGVAPYTPDTQVDVVVEAGRVFVHLPQWFDRPLRLTAEQALTLVAAGQSLLSVHGVDREGPLARALDKLAATLGPPGEQAVDVRVGTAAASTANLLRHAIDEHRRVRLSYYTYGRDEHTVRVVEPLRLFSAQGELYLAARWPEAGEHRVFRVDRIDDADELDETFTPPAEPPARSVFTAAPDDPRVIVDLAPAAAWVVEQYPIEAVEELENGWRRATLAVAAPAWLERLLLRLGPDARVVHADGDLADAAPRAARRVLTRYAQHDDPAPGEG